ncbi:MAG: hypothetical protein KatS3mg027_2372 [Bacteroidia bacterium]|nr:MAG: hypothetical protein KatS3mg027_2372 [Bacteroidia bacterium]
MKLKKNKILLVYTNLQITIGFKRSIIVDNTFNRFYFIPNFLAFIIIENYYKLNFDNILKNYSISKKVLLNYSEFLLNNNLATFITKEDADNFYPMNFSKFIVNSSLTNIVIDYGEYLEKLIDKILNELNKMLVISVDVRVFNIVSIEKIIPVLKKINESRLREINLYMPYSMLRKFPDIHKRFGKINRIFAYNSPFSRVDCFENSNKGFLIFTKQNIINCKNCGVVNPIYFSYSLDHFLESQHYNTCLNRKISIDAEGNIKNCPSMLHSYGNIKNTNLTEVIKKKSFQKYWHIKKDEIAVCKDCEFRHICTDCRAYLENPDDLYSKPLKCGYNPYTCQWEEWSTHPLKQKAIEFYDLKEVISKQNRI